MTWTWTHVASHPDVDARLALEIETVVGDRLPTVDDLPQLVYTRAVLAEALRLRPPAWLLARKALEAVRIGDVDVPAGAIVLMSSYVVQRDPRFFVRPLEYNPSRWLEAHPSGRPKLAYFPFGAGRRSCIGESFAWMEGVLVLATLAQRWKLELADGPGEVDLRITLRPRGEVRMIPRARRAGTHERS
jgi:cytochrome P450